MLDTLLFPGPWRFLRKYPSMACTELIQSFSKAHFCRTLQRLVRTSVKLTLRPAVPVFERKL
jgi:hypothetical protein